MFTLTAGVGRTGSLALAEGYYNRAPSGYVARVGAVDERDLDRRDMAGVTAAFGPG